MFYKMKKRNWRKKLTLFRRVGKILKLPAPPLSASLSGTQTNSYSCSSNSEQGKDLLEKSLIYLQMKQQLSQQMSQQKLQRDHLYSKL